MNNDGRSSTVPYNACRSWHNVYYNKSGDPMCFKSVKTLGGSPFLTVKRSRPKTEAFFTAKDVKLIGLYP